MVKNKNRWNSYKHPKKNLDTNWLQKDTKQLQIDTKWLQTDTKLQIDTKWLQRDIKWLQTDRRRLYAVKTTIKSHKTIAKRHQMTAKLFTQQMSIKINLRRSLNLKTDEGNRRQTHSDVFLIKSTCLGKMPYIMSTNSDHLQTDIRKTTTDNI